MLGRTHLASPSLDPPHSSPSSSLSLSLSRSMLAQRALRLTVPRSTRFYPLTTLSPSLSHSHSLSESFSSLSPKTIGVLPPTEIGEGRRERTRSEEAAVEPQAEVRGRGTTSTASAPPTPTTGRSTQRLFPSSVPAVRLQGRDGPVVLTVTSGKGGVGKTTSAASIGLGLAQRGVRVLLIDFDVRSEPHANALLVSL